VAPLPASGRNARAACAAVSMWVWPARCSVAAVARMMKYITMFENTMPVLTSTAASCSSSSLAPRRCLTVTRPTVISSSTSWLACQKNRYGEIVVPSSATNIATNSGLARNVGITVPRSTSRHAGRAKNAEPM
jgi:hypothetical protein